MVTRLWLPFLFSTNPKLVPQINALEIKKNNFVFSSPKSCKCKKKLLIGLDSPAQHQLAGDSKYNVSHRKIFENPFALIWMKCDLISVLEFSIFEWCRMFLYIHQMLQIAFAFSKYNKQKKEKKKNKSLSLWALSNFFSVDTLSKMKNTLQKKK